MQRIVIFFLVVLMSLLTTHEAGAQGKEKKKKKEKPGKTQAAPAAADLSKTERLLLDAEKSKITEDWEQAEKLYNDLLHEDPDNANAHFQLAQIYFNTGRLAEAEKEGQTAVKLDGGNKWFLEMLAEVYMNQGKAREAVEVFKSLTERFPNNPEYFLNLGFLYARENQFENAIKTYDVFEKNFGVDEQVITEKKNMYLRLNKFNEAVNEVKKLQDAFPGEIEFLLQEAELYRANRMKDKATAVYQKILSIEPDNPQAQLGMTSLSMQGGAQEQTVENLKAIFENSKVNIDTKIGILVLNYIQTNSEDPAKRKEALELATILTRVHPEEAKAFAVEGDVLYIDEQNEKALESYLKALARNKDVFQVWQQVMLIYNGRKDWKNLQKTTGDALELFPNQALIYLFKGGAEQQLKEWEKAVKSYQKGEKMATENDKLRAQLLSNLGDCLHSLNRHTESDSAYDKALRLDPENAYVLNNYSYYLSLRKVNLEKAKQMSALSNKLEPDNSSFLDTYAWILFEMKDYKVALEWLEKALKAGGDTSGTIVEHYGDILFQLGDKTQALEQWKKARDLGSDSTTLEQKIAQGRYIE